MEKEEGVLLFLSDLESFLNRVVPKGASDIQRNEMKKAFVAGAKITAERSSNIHPDEYEFYTDQITDMFEFISKK